MNDDQRDAVLALSQAGMSMAAIARALGISEHSIRGVVSPDYVEKRRERDRERRQGEKALTGFRSRSVKIDPIAVRKAINSIPADTRNLTQRLLGDPLFERSALYKKQQESNGKTHAP